MRTAKVFKVGDFTSGWLGGWKAIRMYCGNVSEGTAKNWLRLYGLPVRRLPGGTPVCLPSELDCWLVRFDDKRHVGDHLQK